MIKRWNTFINESKGIPGPDQLGSIRIVLDDDEMELFSEEAVLTNLISDEKVSLYDNELWFWEGDTKTIDILKGYFPDMDDQAGQQHEEENEAVVNEEFFGGPSPEARAESIGKLRIAIDNALSENEPFAESMISNKEKIKKWIIDYIDKDAYSTKKPGKGFAF